MSPPEANRPDPSDDLFRGFGRYLLVMGVSMGIGGVCGGMVGVVVACLAGAFPAVLMGLMAGATAGTFVGETIAALRDLHRWFTWKFGLALALGIAWCETHVVIAIVRGQVAPGDAAGFVCVALWGGIVVGGVIYTGGIVLLRIVQFVRWLFQKRQGDHVQQPPAQQ